MNRCQLFDLISITVYTNYYGLPYFNTFFSLCQIISTTKSPPPPPPPAPPTLSSITQPKNDKTNPIKRTDSTQQLRKDSIDQKSSMLAEIQRRIQARRQLIDAAEEECGLLKKDHHLEVINLSLLF